MNWKTTLIVSLIAIAYIIIGGAIFKAIEETNEERSRVNATALLDTFLNNHPCLKREETTAVLRSLAMAYSAGILPLDNSSTEVNWNMYNSIFFSLTIVTTIGYGNMAPVTPAGRSFCIFYALVGIPLMLLALAGIGDLLNRLTGFIRGKIPNMQRCCSPKWQKMFSTLFTIVLGLVFLFFIPAAIFQAVEDDWSYRDALYYCFITLSTVGFGDLVAGWPADGRINGHGLYRAFIIIWIFVGLSWLSSFLAACLEAYQGFVSKTEVVADKLENKLEERVDELWNEIRDEERRTGGSKSEKDGIGESSKREFKNDVKTKFLNSEQGDDGKNAISTEEIVPSDKHSDNNISDAKNKTKVNDNKPIWKV